ncbi:MAG: arabinofuranosidase catalytic domain-containing protein [Holosporales bacterium]
MLLRLGSLTVSRRLRAGVLDGVSGIAAAYGLRRLLSGYVGPLVRVRRSSDNAEADIFSADYAGLDTQGLLTFTAAADAFVSRWYDQSGNGRNVIQSLATRQPRLVISGLLQTDSGSRPALNFRGASDVLEHPGFSQSQPYAYHVVWRPVSIIGYGGGEVIIAGHAAGPYASLSFRNDRLFIFAGTSLQILQNPLSAPHVTAAVFNGASSLLRDNGIQVTGNVGTAQDPRSSLGIGAYAGNGSQSSDSFIQEVVVLNGVPDTASLLAIEANQKSWFGL